MSQIEWITQAMATGATGASSVANLAAAGGQYGPGPIFSTLSASSPMVLPRAVIVVTETPRMYNNNLAFSYLIKTAFESGARSVSGIDLGYTLDPGGTEMGRDGQSLEMPLKSKRNPVSPNFVFPEYIGNVIWNMNYKWLTDIQDADTDAIGLKTTLARGEQFDIRLFGATFFVMQPDVTFQASRLVHSWIITNVWPKATGDLGAKIEMTGTHLPERSIPYSGFIIHNNDTIAVGQSLWSQMQLETVNYRKLATGIGSIQDNIKQAGIFRDIQDIIKAGAV